MAFDNVRFPVAVSRGLAGGPERRTDVVMTASGREERNARWAHSRRRYDAGYGVKTLAALSAVVAFFEERRGMLYGFRWRDRGDFKSGAADGAPSPLDQTLGTGDGVRAGFQLVKTYGATFAPYAREIKKPVVGSVRVAVSGVEKVNGVDFDIDANAGLVMFRAGRIPAGSAIITAGFLFDVPVRFDTDYLEIDFAAFEAGEIPKVPIVEIAV